jgi:glycosyltransferase involved in cell wall biosynthesis
LEAIASGLPVVATVSGGVAKIVQSTDSGWVCPIRNAGALCAAMETAIASPDRFERPKRARKLAEELYSAERMSRDYEQLYRTLLQ